MKPQSKVLRFSMFALLYFTQGTIQGYFVSINALYLRDNGVDIAKIGVFAAIAMIPFIIKILFGMLSDRFNFLGLGFRKPYILIGLVVQAACLLLVAHTNPGLHYWTFVALAFFLQMGMAFYDTCTDGLALDITPENEQGILQSFMVGGRSVGIIVSAVVVGFIAQNVSWPVVFYFLAALTLVPVPLLFFIKESVRTQAQRFTWSAFSEFKNGQVLAAAVVGLILFLVVAGANQLMNPFFQERFNIQFDTAGMITAVWGIGAVVGSFAGGMVKDKVGNKAALWASLGTVIPAMLLLAFIKERSAAWFVAAFFGMAYGLTLSIYYALAMKYTKPAIAASMFAILMSVTNVGQAIGFSAGGALAKAGTYQLTFLVFGGVMLLVLPFFPILFKKKAA
jgi:MFS transporter, PAT family, beta-lactamase induction signal transducer AmpG